MYKRPALILTLIAVGLLTACGGPKKFSCKQSDKDYAGAQEGTPLKAAEGLELPDTRNALRIPALDAVERPRGKNEPCLDEPPAFNPAKPLATPPTKAEIKERRKKEKAAEKAAKQKAKLAKKKPATPPTP
jgi:uncharacterized lipoprotein